MTERFRNRYRIKSARAGWWDYASAAAYFITICTKRRHPSFGEISDGIMHLSHVGVMADLMWYEIQHHAKYCVLGPFIVMPDHVHGVLILKDDNHSNPTQRLSNAIAPNHNPKDQLIIWDDGTINPEDYLSNRNVVETRHALSLHFDLLRTDLLRTDLLRTDLLRTDLFRTESASIRNASSGLPKSRFQNQGKNTISAIIGSYKSAVTKHAHRLGHEFAWQPRFYDHIIRDEDELNRISTYIRNNVLNWRK